MSTQIIDTTNAAEYSLAGGNLNSAENQRIRSAFVHRNIIACFSSIVGHFAQNSEACCDGVDYDDILNLCSGQDFQTPGEDAVDAFSRDEMIDFLNDETDVDLEPIEQDDEDAVYSQTDDELRALCHANISDWQEFCNNHEIEPHDLDVYEHWAVDNWMAARLKEHGEIVGDFFDFKVWGRCCTGQAIQLDSVIGSICAAMQILAGQKHEWKDC